MILIADAHAGDATAEAFFEMLDVIARTGEEVVFLGDIFDLWIGFPRYETAIHRRFLEWCRYEKGRRTVGFVEGNHEFFVARRHSSAFTWCARIDFRDAADRLFVHGDLIDRRDWRYRLFRMLAKGPLAYGYLAVGPGGPALVRWVKRRLERKGSIGPKSLPRDFVDRFAERCFTQGVRRVFCGHFHPACRSEDVSDGQVVIVPPWDADGCIALVALDGRVRIGPWRTLLSADGVRK